MPRFGTQRGMRKETPPRFPADSAFVIQFAKPRAAGDPGPGRVEHITSGQARRFQDATQLMAFVAEVLAALDGDQSAETSETQP